MTATSPTQSKFGQTLTAILYWEEDVYVAECPEVGTASQGDTVEKGPVVHFGFARADLGLETSLTL